MPDVPISSSHHATVATDSLRKSGAPHRPFTCAAATLALGVVSFAHAGNTDEIRWRLPTEVLGAGDVFSPTILGDMDHLPTGQPKFGDRMAVTHIPGLGTGGNDVFVAASLSGVSMRRTASGGFEPYPDCDSSTTASRTTGAVAILRLPHGGLQYTLEAVILPSAPEVEAVLPALPNNCDYFGGCVAGTRLSLSGRSLATIAGGVDTYAEQHPAVSRLRVHRRTAAGAWIEEPVRIDGAMEDPWITAADVDFVDEDTLVAIAENQVVTENMDMPPRELHVFKRTAATAGGFEWISSPDFPDLAFTAHDLGAWRATTPLPQGSGEWPRLDATIVDGNDPAGAGIRVVIGAPGYTVQPPNSFPQRRGAVYRVHLPDLALNPKAGPSSVRIAEGEDDAAEAPLDRRVGYSVAIDAERTYFSAIGTTGFTTSETGPDAIVAIAHDDVMPWQVTDAADRVIITPSLLPSPIVGGSLEPIVQREGIGFGRDMAIQRGGLVVRSEQYAFGIVGGPVLAERYEPVPGQSAWRRADVYETGRPTREETYGRANGSLAVSDSGLVLLGEPTFGGGLTEDPGSAWIFSDVDDSNGDGAPDTGEADGVELVVIDEWSVDLGTGGLGSQQTSPILRAIGISEQLRDVYAGQPVRVTCIRTAHLGVSLQPAVLEYSSSMQSSHGFAHILADRMVSIDPVAGATLPIANCLRSSTLGYRPAHEAELLSDVAARWPWRAKNRVVLALTHDCDQLEVPNLVIAPENEPSVVSAVVHEVDAINEHRTNLFDFLGAVERANSLSFGGDYDQRLTCEDGSPSCDLVPCIAPRLFSNGAFDPTLGYSPANGVAARIRADFDRDGSVGAADVAVLLGGWGTSSGDVTGDGMTDAADVASLLAAWFTNPCR